MYDDMEEVIMNHYPRCEQFIDKALGQEGNVVLIHWLVIGLKYCKRKIFCGRTICGLVIKHQL